MRTVNADEVDRAKEKFYIDATGDAPHVKWKSNDRVPFDDMLEAFCKRGWITRQEWENSKEVRAEQDRVAIAEYKANYKGPSEEELFEMRAAFGRGAKVVNVITGKEIQL